MDDTTNSINPSQEAEDRLEALARDFASYVEATTNEYIERTGGASISATALMQDVYGTVKAQKFMESIAAARAEVLRVGGSLARFAVVSGPGVAFKVSGIVDAYEEEGIYGVVVEAGRIASSGLGSAAGGALASAALIALGSAPIWLAAATGGAFIVGGGVAGVFVYDVLVGKKSIIGPNLDWGFEEWESLRDVSTFQLEIVSGTDWSRRAVWDTEAGTVEISAPTEEFELSMVRSVLARDDITSVILNGKRFSLESLDQTDLLTARNSIHAIAEQSYETAEVALTEGDLLNVGRSTPHSVQAGDTAQSLASRYGLEIKDLVAANTWLVDEGRISFLHDQVLVVDGDSLDRSGERTHYLLGTPYGDYLADMNGGDDGIFGGNGNNELRGGDGEDGLYGGLHQDLLVGGSGADTLFGNLGDDRLIGGSDVLDDDGVGDILIGGLGFDSYWVGAGDVINDADGMGEIYLDGVLLSGGVHRSGDTYASEDGSVVYRYQQGSLLINDSIRISEFNNGQLGLSFEPSGGNDPELPGATYQVNPQSPPYNTPFPDNDQVAEHGYYGTAGWQSPNVITGDDGDEIIAATGSDQRSIYTVAGGVGDSQLEGDDAFNWLVDDAFVDSDGVVSNIGGTFGDDRLSGNGGEDWLISHGGNDWLSGGEGDDLLIDNPDSVWGGTDWIQAVEHTSDDVLDGGAGDDFMVSNGGNDLLQGGAGNDTIYGGAHDDVLYGGDGDDILGGDTRLARGVSPIQFGTAGNADQVTLGLDIESETVWYGRDTLMGGDGEDLLVGGGGDDVLDGGPGDDQLQGDYLAADGGDPRKIHGADSLFGGSGADTLYGGAGDDLLDGGSGNDYLLGGSGDDTYAYSDRWGRDVVSDTEGADRFLFAELNDPEELKFRREGDDLYVSHPDGGSGVRVLNAYREHGSSVQEMVFGSGITLTRDDFLNAGLHQVGSDRADTLMGYDDSSDHLQGGGDDDHLSGAAGDDLLEGGSGEDVLVGGAGSDTLIGGLGSDSYHVGDGSGVDILVDDVSDGESNRVVLAPTMVSADIEASRLGQDLVMEWRGGSGGATIQDYFLSPGAWQLSLASGASVDIEQLLSPTGLRPDLVARAWESFEQTMYDQLLPEPWKPGNVGSDIYTSLRSQLRFDVPQIFGGIPAGLAPDLNHFSIFTGPVGWTWLSGIPGGQVDPRLQVVTTTGTTGADSIARVAGELTERETRRGKLVLENAELQEDGSVWADVTGLVYQTDRSAPIHGNGPTMRANVSIRTYQMQKIYAGAGDDDVGADTRSRFNSSLYDQDVWWQSRQSVSLVDGGEGNDWLDGGINQDFLLGGPGDDQLLGYYGDDTLAGGQGRDVLQGGDGADTYLVGAGDSGFDLIADHGLFADRGILSYMPFDQHSSLRSAKDGSEKQILTQWLGGENREHEDWMSADLLHVEAPIDTVRVYHAQHEDRPALLLTWGPNEQSGAMVLMRGEGDVLGYGIERFRFDDAEFSRDELLALARPEGAPEIGPFAGAWTVHSAPGLDTDDAVIEGTPDDDFLSGTASSDRILGKWGDDEIEGLGGDDVLKGGRGTDEIFGGAGDDRIVGGRGNDYLAGGDGDDRFRVRGAHSGVDTLDGGSGFDRLVGSKLDDVFRIAHLDSGSSIEKINGRDGKDRISGTNEANWIDLSAATLVSVERINARAGDDTVFGSDGDDRIRGARGGDVLRGGRGADVLVGGKGDDHLWGGAGRDKFRFGVGAGHDIVHNELSGDSSETSSHEDRIVFGKTVTAEDLWFERVDNDLRVTVGGSEAAIDVEGWYSAQGHDIEGFKLSDGSFLSEARVQLLVEAMAGLPAVGPGDIDMSQVVREELNHVIDVSWAPGPA